MHGINDEIWDFVGSWYYIIIHSICYLEENWAKNTKEQRAAAHLQAEKTVSGPGTIGITDK